MKPGDYDPWKVVTVVWDGGTTTHTWVRRSEIGRYLDHLPIERIEIFEFKSPEYNEAPRGGAVFTAAERDAPPQ